MLEDGRVLEVENVIWCTGFHPGLLMDRFACIRIKWDTEA